MSDTTESGADVLVAEDAPAALAKQPTPIATGAWVVCEVGSPKGPQRFTALVKDSLRAGDAFIYQVQAELPQGQPVFGVRADQIVRVF